jgi:hypothetical protein
VAFGPHLVDERLQQRLARPLTHPEILEVVGRLEALAVVKEETRSSVFAALKSGDVPEYASAYQAMFAAVAMLSSAQAARVIDATFGAGELTCGGLSLAKSACHQAALGGMRGPATSNWLNS